MIVLNSFNLLVLFTGRLCNLWSKFMVRLFMLWMAWIVICYFYKLFLVFTRYQFLYCLVYLICIDPDELFEYLQYLFYCYDCISYCTEILINFKASSFYTWASEDGPKWSKHARPYCHMYECDCRQGLDWRLDLFILLTHAVCNYK
jgi:hypothetical protein